VAKSCAVTALTVPSPAILPLQVSVFVPPELLVVQVGVQMKCGLAANTRDGVAIMANARNVAAADILIV
jgi:hypothetical protein